MIKQINCNKKNYLNNLTKFLDVRRSSKKPENKIISKVLSDIKKNKNTALIKYEKKFSKNKINRYLKKYNHVIFQKYISKISKGDKRVFIINGKVKGVISRVPKKGSILSNISKGAYARTININSNELKISS